jgi:hypothetical protein
VKFVTKPCTAGTGGYVIAARILTIYYFAFFFVILPLLGLFEKTKPLPNSISEQCCSTAFQPTDRPRRPLAHGAKKTEHDSSVAPRAQLTRHYVWSAAQLP